MKKDIWIALERTLRELDLNDDLTVSKFIKTIKDPDILPEERAARIIAIMREIRKTKKKPKK